MPRKHGKDKKKRILEWLEGLRKYILLKFHHNGIEVVSANDVRTLLQKREYPMPPPIEGDGIKEGQAWCNVFRTHYYEKTGDTLLSNATSYKIDSYRYVPEHDDRFVYGPPKVAFSSDDTDW